MNRKTVENAKEPSRFTSIQGLCEVSDSEFIFRIAKRIDGNVLERILGGFEPS